MLAIGQVRINSPQLIGKLRSAGSLVPTSDGSRRPQGPAAGWQPRAIRSSAVIRRPGQCGCSVPSRRPTDWNACPDLAAHGVDHKMGRRNVTNVDGQRIRVQLITQGDATTVEDLAVDGQVHLVEIQTPLPGDQPLRVSGDSLQVVRASEPDTGVTVSGRPAQAASRGMEMYGDVVRLDKGTNRLWIDGPGRMKLPANQVMSDNGGGLGGPLATGSRAARRGTGPAGATTGAAASFAADRYRLARTHGVRRPVGPLRALGRLPNRHSQFADRVARCNHAAARSISRSRNRANAPTSAASSATATC